MGNSLLRSASIRLHLYGDSLVRGDLGDDWWRRFPRADSDNRPLIVENLARNGETFESLLALLKSDPNSPVETTVRSPIGSLPNFVLPAANATRDLAIVCCGTNDALAKTSRRAQLMYDWFWRTSTLDHEFEARVLEVATRLLRRYTQVAFLLPPRPHVSHDRRPFGRHLSEVRLKLQDTLGRMSASGNLGSHAPLCILDPLPSSNETGIRYGPAFPAIALAFLKRRILHEPTADHFWHEGVHLGRKGGDVFLRMSLEFIKLSGSRFEL